MTESKSTIYFWCCIAQSLLIIGLAFYAGNQKSEKETLLKEKEMNAFALTVREAEVTRLKAIVDTCNAKKE